VTQRADTAPGAAGPSRRLAVILAADVVGYGRLVSEDEEGTLAILATYHEVIAGLVVEHQGRIFNRAGDGVLAELSSPVQAVRCAVAIQRALRRRNTDLPESRRLLLRIGINLGDVVAQGGDLLGDGVNIAARLQALAEPEQVVISAAVQEQVAGKLAFPSRPLGERALKNIARPVRIHGVDWSLEAPVPISELRSGALPLPDRPSIAVLPFTNMSQDPEQEYFADGLSEDLITALAKYRWFFVIARNSSFTYKGRATTVQQVGRDLGVRYVLEGSVRRAGAKVRVTAQLAEAETGHHLWAERYDRDLADLFAVQDEIVGRIVAVIEPGMMRSETQRAQRMTPESLTAWDLIFQGMWHFHHMLPKHHSRARDLFREAIEADPSLPEGHMWLVRSINSLIYYGWSDDDTADRAEQAEALRNCLRLSEPDPYTLYAQAIVSSSTGAPARGMAAAQRAIDLSPSFALGHYILGVSRLGAGRAAAAIEPFLRGFRLNPNDSQAFLWMAYLGFAHYLTGDCQEAADRAADAVAMRPDSYTGQCVLACSLAQLGRESEARRAVGELQRVLPSPGALDRFVARFNEPADRAKIVDGLRRAGWPRSPDVEAPASS
jgi:adenylate cyclase